MDTSPADIALAAFALCNSIRVFAYVPQIVSVARDRNGATAISYTTWSLFAVSHLSTVTYAILTLDDWRMAAVFAANAACCTVIVGLTALKRAGLKLTADPPICTIAYSAAPCPAPQRDGALTRAALTVDLSRAPGPRDPDALSRAVEPVREHRPRPLTQHVAGCKSTGIMLWSPQVSGPIPLSPYLKEARMRQGGDDGECQLDDSRTRVHSLQL